MPSAEQVIAQVFTTALAALVAALVDDRIDFTEWLNVGVLALGSVAVLGAGDLPAGVWRYTKPIVSAAQPVQPHAPKSQTKHRLEMLTAANTIMISRQTAS